LAGSDAEGRKKKRKVSLYISSAPGERAGSERGPSSIRRKNEKEEKKNEIKTTPIISSFLLTEW